MDTRKKKPLYSVMEGILYPPKFSPKCFAESLRYKPRDDDVLIVTYPKCGTTWMQSLVLHIFRKGEELTDYTEFRTWSPFINCMGQEGIDRMPRPGAIKTHLPFDRMQHNLQAKHIFVARNPKDCCVSFYYHTKMARGSGFFDGTFDDFFEVFMTGELEFNDYFDHLLSWFPHRNEPNMFYTTYEDMKKDTESIVIRLANFLGKEYGELVEKDNTVLRNILHFSSFIYMKKHINSALNNAWRKDKMQREETEGRKHVIRSIEGVEPPESKSKFEFIRKGEIGDWRNHFSGEQCERLQRKFDEKFKGTEIPGLWSSDILY